MSPVADNVTPVIPFSHQVVEIERARALRLAKEQADEALEAAQRSSLLLRKHELHTSTEQAALLTETSVRQAESKLLETVGLIQEESTKLLEAERVHTLRQNKARMAARQAQLRQEYAERSGAQLQSVLSAQGELQAQVLRLQQAALRSEMDRDMAYSTNTAARPTAKLPTTLFASRGTIMLTAGDEFGRTQQGNNNAYAQDNAIGWVDWQNRDRDLEDFVAALAAFGYVLHDHNHIHPRLGQGAKDGGGDAGRDPSEPRRSRPADAAAHPRHLRKADPRAPRPAGSPRHRPSCWCHRW